MIIVIHKSAKNYRNKKVAEYESLAEFLEPDDFFRFTIYQRDYFSNSSRKKSIYGSYKRVFTKSARKKAIANKKINKKPYKEQRMFEKRRFAYKHQEAVYTIFAPFYIYYNLEWQYRLYKKLYYDSINYGIDRSMRSLYAESMNELSFLKDHYRVTSSLFKPAVHFSFLKKDYIISELTRIYSINWVESKDLFKELCDNDILQNSRFDFRNQSDYYEIGKTLSQYNHILSSSDYDLFSWIKTKLPQVKPTALSLNDLSFNQHHLY